MHTQDSINYTRIAQAIAYIQAHFKEQPSLEEIAGELHLSPFHFQRLFSEWAGTSPKNFLQYTSLQFAKSLLKENQATLFDTAHETGLSGTGRLHDLFIKIEGMTPAEYKNGGKALRIAWSLYESPFGPILAASTEKGICHLAFYENADEALQVLQSEFPNANIQQQPHPFHEQALRIFYTNDGNLPEIKLHLKGTEFQLKVWESLLKIPMGQLSTYGKLAQEIQSPGASRAVGTAIGSNPVAYLIPCHRVIQSSGNFGGYMWNPIRKTAIIGWEMAKTV